MSNLTPEPEYTPEEEPLEVRMIKQQWQEWNELVDTKGRDYEDVSEKYEFVIDRRQENESFVTADNVQIIQINEPLENWTNAASQIISKEGEEWIHVTVKPKNPYKPKLGVLFDNGHDFYFTEMVEIYLSNQAIL